MNNFLEKTLEQIIMSNLDKMPSKGLDIFYKNTVNQIAFNTNIADIFTWEEIDDVLYCRIIELKKEHVDLNAFKQIFNYKYDLFIFIHKNYMHIKDIKIELILIGCTFKDDLDLISAYVGLRLYEYTYGIDGIVFKEKEQWFCDDFTKQDYKERLSMEIDLSKVNSFTNDVIGLARGKMSS